MIQDEFAKFLRRKGCVISPFALEPCGTRGFDSPPSPLHTQVRLTQVPAKPGLVSSSGPTRRTPPGARLVHTGCTGGASPWPAPGVPHLRDSASAGSPSTRTTAPGGSTTATAAGRSAARSPPTRAEAEQVAAQVNAQLTSGAPTLLAFTPIGVPELRRRFLDYHEHVLRSSVGTVRRYRAATQHLEDFVLRQSRPPQAHEVRPDAFAAYLRTVEVAPNGHPNTAAEAAAGQGRPVHPGDLPVAVQLRAEAAAPAALRREPVLGAAAGPAEGPGRQADLRLRRRHRAGLPQGGVPVGLPDPLHAGQDRAAGRRAGAPAGRGGGPRRAAGCTSATRPTWAGG